MSAAPTLLAHHARELFEGSGIDPAIAAERGYRTVTAAECAALGFAPYQCGAGLLFPQWTLAGVQRGFKLKRDRPRTDQHGKGVKYEFPEGAVSAFDVHPSARHLLRDPNTTLYLTEGIKKSDAGCSRGALFVDVGSVWMFLRGRLVVPDLDEIPLDGRRVRVVYDSDIISKPPVTEALHRLCHALHRRGATVEVIHLPQGPDATKIGIDDFFAAGGTIADLESLSRPWRGEGAGIWLNHGGESDIEAMRRERDQARDDAGALVRAILNPDLSRQELVAAVSTAAGALAKQARGEVEPDGTVVLSTAEIAHDYRPKPAKGGHVAPTNPLGDRPRLARDRVRPIIIEAVERGLIRAKPRPALRRHADGSTYKTTDWVIDPIPSIAAALDPWAAYRPNEPTIRKPREVAQSCPSCGEVHPILRRDACTGCGAVIAERIIAPTAASDILSEARTTPPEGSPPAPYVPLSDKLSEPPATPRPSPLVAAQSAMVAADRAPDQEPLQRATDDLAASLGPIAADRGRTAVPILAADPEAMDQRRVAAVVAALAAEGRPVMFDEVARRSGLKRVQLINRLDLHAIVLQAKTAGGSRAMAAPPTEPPVTPALPTEGSPLGSAWLRGESYPPTGPTPVDRWTR